jgi:ubiquinone/menaquinone biosynthesis C-methylase UbiE
MTNPAETYEAFMVPPLFAPFARRLVDLAAPQRRDRVLDVGCGTGIAARDVAARLGPDASIVGLDASPDMLAVARSVADARGIQIDWREGRAEALPFPDGSFSLVLCQFALMFFTDRDAALSEMRRVLADRGRAAINVWQSIDLHPFYQTLDLVIEQHLGTASGQIRDIFLLADPDELRRMLTDAGFRDAQITPVSLTARFPNPEGFLAGEIDVDTASIPAMQRLDAEERQALVAGIRADMEEPLSAVTAGGYVIMPFHAYLVQARC